MSDQTVVLTDSASNKSSTLPIVKGSLGDPAIDIGKLNKDTGYFTYDPGFMSTAACRSAITFIDGDKGVLLYRGYPIEQLAKHSSFLEVAYLLINGDLPTPDRVQRVRGRSHASHDDARVAEELPQRFPLRRASDGDAVRHRSLRCRRSITTRSTSTIRNSAVSPRFA